MDASVLENLVEQAGGIIVAVVILLRIEKRLDVLISDLETFIASMKTTHST